jgi:hypothetical protein
VFPVLFGRDVYALMMMHSDVCVVDDDDERGIGWGRNLDCEKVYLLMLMLMMLHSRNWFG